MPMLLVFASFPILASEDSDLPSQLRACALKADRSDRLDCYDSISRGLAPASAAAASTAAVATPASSVPAAAEATPKPDDADRGVPVKSISCQRGHSNEYIFSLDNGEIWKQVGSNRIRLSSCEFSGHIEKDFFGYKMIVDGENVKFRVKRLN